MATEETTAMRHPWAIRLAVLAVAVASFFPMRSLLSDLQTGDEISGDRLLPFLAFHALGTLSFALLMWLGVPNRSRRRSVRLLNIAFRCFAVLVVFLAGVVYSRFLQLVLQG